MLSKAKLSWLTDVVSGDSSVAVDEKPTIPIALPEPIVPSFVPSVDSSMMSMNALAPAFRLSKGTPAILPDLSSISTMSVGELTMSGDALSASITLKLPLH